MTRPILLALAALIVAGWVRRRRRTVQQPSDDYSEPWDDSAVMCPNCVTPWKCNGPHVIEDTPWYQNSHTVRIRWAPTTTEV